MQIIFIVYWYGVNGRLFLFDVMIIIQGCGFDWIMNMNFIRCEIFDMWDGVNNLFFYFFLGKNFKFKILVFIFGKIGKFYMKY